jgi:O-antigen ligase
MRERIFEVAYAIAIACFLLSVYNKSATALEGIGTWVPAILWLLRPWIAPVPRPYLRDPLIWVAMAFIVMMEATSAWSPKPLASFDQFRRELGAVACVMLSLADAGSMRQVLGRWCLVLVAGLAWHLGMHAREWAQLALAAGTLLPDYGLLRDYGYGNVFALPFLFAARRFVAPRWRAGLLALAIAAAVLAVTTGARGTWLAFAATLGGAALLFGSRKLAAGVAAVGLGAALVFAALAPGNTITANIARGLDTSYRASGTWAPAIEMIAERPVLGHGLGRFVFDRAYDERRPSRPHWVFERSPGPHSTFLDTAFAGGLVALALYIALCAAIVRRAWTLGRDDTWRGDLAKAVLLSFAGQYLIYGFIESMSWLPLGIHLGLLLALSQRRDDKAVS